MGKRLTKFNHMQEDGLINEDRLTVRRLRSFMERSAPKLEYLASVMSYITVTPCSCVCSLEETIG